MKAAEYDAIFHNLLETAPRLAQATAGDAAYRLLQAAISMAYTDEMQSDVRSVLRTIASDSHLGDAISAGYDQEDFERLAAKLAKHRIAQQRLSNDLDR